MIKQILTITFALGILLQGGESAIAQQLPFWSRAARARITIKVKDQDNKPLEGAYGLMGWELTGSFHPNGSSSDGIRVPTDATGTAVLETRTPAGVSIGAEKEGYYQTYGDMVYFHGPEVEGLRDVFSLGKWKPWNPTYEYVLKKKLNPIRLYGARNRLIRLRKFGEFYGFDLSCGDLVVPYGKGKHTDLYFRLEKGGDYPPGRWDVTITIKFPNEGDGILPVKVPRGNKGSVFKMPYAAPEQDYQPQFQKRYWRLEVEGKTQGSDFGENGVKPEEHYFFRVRTVLDEKGNVISAHYAKIDSRLGFDWEGHIEFDYYFNPTLNERNLEQDPSKLSRPLP